MPYKFVNKDTVVPSRKLGIKADYNSPGIFSTNITTINQAKSNLKNLLLTRVGERIENVEFGTRILNLLFNPITADLKQKLNKEITNSIDRWLPSVLVEDINIKTNEDDPKLDYSIVIEISFTTTTSQVTEEIILSSAEAGELEVS